LSKDHIKILSLASSHLTRAEELFEKGEEFHDEAVLAAQEAYNAISSILETNDILVVLPVLPQRMWGELLRLNEIKRTISAMEGEKALEAAREAVEIATALILYSFDTVNKK